MLSFDLTREPWIPVERLDGTTVEQSTREVLRDAHRIRSIVDMSPLVVVVLTRHLLAVLHRAYAGPRTLRAWTTIVTAGAFDEARVAAYLDTVSDRMDLFHPTHPFAQTRGLVEQFGDSVVRIDELELLRSSWGGARSLFRHRPESPPPSMTPARAARALLAHHAFMTGGLVRKPNEPVAATAAPLVRAGVVLLRGATLFETLVSNLLRYDPEESMPIPLGGGADACSWEQPPPPRELPMSDEPKRLPLGYLDMLTWQSRRVELVHDGAKVTGFINAVWQGMAADAPQDPMVTYRRDEERGLVSVGVSAERSFWRDANALFEVSRDDDARFIRPKAIALVATDEAIDALGAKKVFAVEVSGIDAEKSLVHAMRVERISASASSFDDPDARAAVESCLDVANKAIEALYGAMYLFAKHAITEARREADKNDVKKLIASLGTEGAAWSALGVEFDAFMSELSTDPNNAAKAFAGRAVRVIRDVFKGATYRPDDSSRWLEASVRAEASLNKRLSKLQGAAEPAAKEVQA